jgi:hypothetical protein
MRILSLLVPATSIQSFPNQTGAIAESTEIVQTKPRTSRRKVKVYQALDGESTQVKRVFPRFCSDVAVGPATGRAGVTLP